MGFLNTWAGPMFLNNVRLFSMGSRAATLLRFLVMTARTGSVFLLKLSIVRTGIREGRGKGPEYIHAYHEENENFFHADFS